MFRQIQHRRSNQSFITGSPVATELKLTLCTVCSEPAYLDGATPTKFGPKPLKSDFGPSFSKIDLNKRKNIPLRPLEQGQCQMMSSSSSSARGNRTFARLQTLTWLFNTQSDYRIALSFIQWKARFHSTRHTFNKQHQGVQVCAAHSQPGKVGWASGEGTGVFNHKIHWEKGVEICLGSSYFGFTPYL
jgi:hypothetical protein